MGINEQLFHKGYATPEMEEALAKSEVLSIVRNLAATHGARVLYKFPPSTFNGGWALTVGASLAGVLYSGCVERRSGGTWLNMYKYSFASLAMSRESKRYTIESKDPRKLTKKIKSLLAPVDIDYLNNNSTVFAVNHYMSEIETLAPRTAGYGHKSNYDLSIDAITYLLNYYAGRASKEDGTVYNSDIISVLDKFTRVDDNEREADTLKQKVIQGDFYLVAVAADMPLYWVCNCKVSFGKDGVELTKIKEPAMVRNIEDYSDDPFFVTTCAMLKSRDSASAPSSPDGSLDSRLKAYGFDRNSAYNANMNVFSYAPWAVNIFNPMWIVIPTVYPEA